MNIPVRIPNPFVVDPDEAHEIAREEALEEFREWQGRDYERREFEDFGDWLARMSQPHMVGCEKYVLAMNYAERLTDEQLVAHSKIQGQFKRLGDPFGPGCDPSGSAAVPASSCKHRIPIAGDGV